MEDSLSFLEDCLYLLEDSLSFLEDSLSLFESSLALLEDSLSFLEDCLALLENSPSLLEDCLLCCHLTHREESNSRMAPSFGLIESSLGLGIFSFILSLTFPL